MCNSASPRNTKLVQAAIDNLVGQDEMFTAWDVTSLARQAGEPGTPGEDRANESHHVLKTAVHEFRRDGRMDDADYDATVIQGVPGASPDPFVFHRKGTDAREYLRKFGIDPHATATVGDADTDDDGDTDDYIAPPGTAPAAPAVPAMAASPAASAISATVTTERRLTVPHDVVHGAGFKKGNILTVRANGTHLYIFPEGANAANAFDEIGKVEVNGDGRLRLSRNSIDRLNTTETSFNVSRTGEGIIVSVA